MNDDVIGFTYFLNISYKQHQKDFPHDTITFVDFSTICLNKWDSLEEEPKSKIIELAKKENDEIKKERNVIGGEEDNPIELESDNEDNKNNITFDVINVNKIIEIGETIKKNFGQHYTYCKKPRSAYIYFVKASHIYCKEQGQCSRENFVEISRTISGQWNELKVNQRKVFADCALLDKRFNGFKSEAIQKKKALGSHTSLFLKAKQEARDHHATTSTAGAVRLTNRLSNVRRTASSSTRASSTRVKRKTRRKKKRKTTKTTKTRVKTESRSMVKRENKPLVKIERKFKVKKECKVKREI